MSPFLDSFSTLITVSIVLTWAGLGKKYPFELLGEHGFLIGAITWGIVTAVFLGCLAKGVFQFGSPVRIKFRMIPILIILSGFLTAGFDLIQWVHFRHLGYRFPIGLLIFDVAFACYLVFRVRSQSGEGEAPIRIAWVGSVIHRLLSIVTFPLIAARSDMLLTIEEGLQRFLEGVGPYSPSNQGLGRMLYLPITWLSFLPAKLAHFDPRWVGLVFLIAIGVSLERSQHRQHTPASWLIPLWLLNPYLQFRHELYLDGFWLLCSLSTWAALRGRFLLVALLSGVTLATLQFGWVIAPFWWLAATYRRGYRALIGCVFLSVLVGAIIIFPFWVTHPKEFFNAVLIPLAWLDTYRGELCLGFAPILFVIKKQNLLIILQAILSITMAISAFWFWERSPRKVLECGTLAFFGFIFFNHFIENYFYLAPTLIGVVLSSYRSESE